MNKDILKCLSKTRVLDLTTESGFMCGKMLADLGVDVIKVELQGAKQASTAAHLYGETACPEKDLYWFAYNAGKRCITLNLETVEGVSLLKKLVEKISIVVESFSPGKMKQWGLDYEELSEINTGLVYTSITPFGRSGPYKDYKVTDLVAMAMGGPLFLTGDADRPPVQAGFPQAYLHAGAEACVATLMALYQAEMTGEGQLVDVSIQESVIKTTFNTVYTWVTEQIIVSRMGPSRMVGRQLEMPLTWQCKDGFVNFGVVGGASGGKTMKNLADWMEEEGMGDEAISGTDWGSFDFYGLTTGMVENVSKPIKRFFSNYTREELFVESIRRGVMLFPVASADGILADVHLEKKGFWQGVEHPDMEDKIAFPKAPFRINDEYPSLRARAPFKGEHNNEVYQELLGVSEQDLKILKAKGIV